MVSQGSLYTIAIARIDSSAGRGENIVLGPPETPQKIKQPMKEVKQRGQNNGNLLELPVK
eukprot:5319588-Amphidinium_carterae.1